MMLNNTQVQFINKGSISYINTTSTIYHLVLHMATSMKDIFPFSDQYHLPRPELEVYVL